MRRLFLCTVIFLCLAFWGCGQPKPEKQLLAAINDYRISKERFESEFKESVFGQEDTPEAKREFLNILIDRKVILQDAQQKGLDKEQGFLRLIQKFWEQSLLKIALDKKSREISGTLAVSEEEIKASYDALVRDKKIGKPYDEARERVRRELLMSKESRAINDWVLQLRNNAQIKIHEESLQ